MVKFPNLKAEPIFALDLETTGLHWWKDEIFGVAVSTKEQDYYWDVRREPAVLRWLRDQMPQIRLWVNHNIKFDALFLMAAEIFPDLTKIDCTMIRACLINEHEFSYDLDNLGRKYLKQGKVTEIYEELARLLGGPPTRHAQAKNLHRAPMELVGKYAKQDTRLALNYWHWQEKEIDAQDLRRILGLERRLLPVVIAMERGGVPVDVQQAERAVQVISDEIESKQNTLDKLAGFAINPNPSSSIVKLFSPVEREDGRYTARDGTVLERTDGGKPQINAEALRRMSDPAAGMILDLRILNKMKDTFLLGHVLGHHHNGIIHCNFNQTKGDNEHGTGTGRFSVDSPALQQIPKRNKKVAAVVRACFVPDPDCEWCCADWSQFEFRWFAHFSQSPPVLAAYAKDPKADFHGMIAGITGLPRNKTPEIKGNAKQINLGLVFGMGQGKMAMEMGLPFYVERDEQSGKEWLRAGPEAEAVFATYHAAVPGVKQFLQKAASVARERGYVQTMWGRHIRFPGGQFTHKAGGLVLQSNAADALKWKMIQLHEAIEAGELRARMMLVVHDENNLSLRPRDTKAVKTIKAILEDFGPDTEMPMRVPVITEPTVAANWWEASKD